MAARWDINDMAPETLNRLMANNPHLVEFLREQEATQIPDMVTPEWIAAHAAYTAELEALDKKIKLAMLKEALNAARKWGPDCDLVFNYKNWLRVQEGKLPIMRER